MSYFVLFFRALEVDDKCEFAYETLGTVEVQRGNLTKAVQLFEKAIPLVIIKIRFTRKWYFSEFYFFFFQANTELEMAHLFGLRDAALAQTTVSNRLGITMPGMMS